MSAHGPRYGMLQRALHWWIAGVLPAQWLLGWLAERASARTLEDVLLVTHFQLGLLIFTAMAWRILARWRHGAPDAPPGCSAAVRMVRRATHLALYALLLVLPISGYVLWHWNALPLNLFGVDLPALFVPPVDDERARALAWYLHVYAAWLLLGLIGTHLSAGAWHHLIRHQPVLQRMR